MILSLSKEMGLEKNCSRLNGRDNFLYWKTEAESLLIVRGLWNYVEEGLSSTATAAEKKRTERH